MSNPTQFQVECPGCQNKFPITVPVSAPAAPTTKGGIPVVRSKLKPLGNIHVYQITSEEIKQFLIEKARYYKPEVKIELGVKYCERKKSTDDDRRSYAALTIAFSDDVIDSKPGAGWFDKIGEGETNARLIDDIFVEFIRRYQYDRKLLDEYLNDYKKLEQLEDRLGITESFLEDIRMYTMPRRIATTAKESWIFFAARPEKIIEDMLQDPVTDKVAGGIHIAKINQINKDVVEYVVYVHPGEMHATENPLVRQILTGQKNIKKK